MNTELYIPPVLKLLSLVGRMNHDILFFKVNRKFSAEENELQGVLERRIFFR